MKISDIIFRYPTLSVIRNDGICRVRVFINENRQVVALLTDIGNKNTAASVTNSIEIIHTSLITRGIISEEAIIIEHYENRGCFGESFDVVSFNSNGTPQWTRMNQHDLLSLLECEQSELSQLTVRNPRLLAEIDRVRYEINPNADFPYREDPEVVKRRMEIELNSISKVNIQKLIQKGVKEQELLKLLKRDLSVFGEVYANPKDEYICFSEFPISDGFVDFAVFTGRSRMDIYLIEIKGANFNLVNQSSYESFSSKVEEAAGQLRRRLGDINWDYKSFREEAHRIRGIAESGESIFNSLVGPEGALQVDPNKHVNIFTVLIGGRTVDDIKESRKRYDYENSFKPSIKVESWDTWLRKLRRD
ncbi:DUF4263 domain-containing protein [Paenibacillus sp. SC116]|uniref:Shedu immune nuclease family protein n=1 Tax=Paenibacillus sp. SC116 TaxID=2968986 RepID=UPI00215B4C9E|nr:Shedu immune nuclease family protein [Paenibacillus sp. SC116]MCR8843429.1 DUF4263 domain-containing protein [Paenibacillus sp. SC116]